MTSVVLAGGGTAGHIEPALNTADALRRLAPQTRVTMLGTERGLETRLVPERGYDLRLIPPVPLPRRLTAELAHIPRKVSASVRETADVLRDVAAQVVVGYGGYVSLPAYLAARRLGIPVVVHEANMRPGLANRIGARFAVTVATAAPDVRLPRAQSIGIPLRRAVADLDRETVRAAGRQAFGLDADRPTLLVFGGSQGAQAVNAALAQAAPGLLAAGIQVLHAVGPKNTVEPAAEEGPDGARYVTVPYIDRMDLAYAAADLAVCRCGAMTCAELTAVGLPAVFVPLPIGNGEQRLNAEPVVSAGGGLLVDNANLTADWVVSHVPPLFADTDRLAAMSAAAASLGNREADSTLAKLVLEAAGSQPPRMASKPHRDDPAASRPHRDEPAHRDDPAGREEPVVGWEAGTGAVMTAADLDAIHVPDLGPTHFIAIGGSGMSAVARVLHARGVTVTGSDASDSGTLRSLQELGIDARVGHDPDSLGDARTVVISTAVTEENVELAEARRRGLRILHRAAALAVLMHGYRGVAVAGTHGKTTTTWMSVLALKGAGVDPSYVVGADLDKPGTNGHHSPAEHTPDGDEPVLVAEADESDRSFLLFEPTVSIVTNIEADHLDHYADLADIITTFEEFVGRLRPGGSLVYCHDDPHARRLGERARQRGVRTASYGVGEGAALRLTDIVEDPAGVSYVAAMSDGSRLPVTLRVHGRHMAMNSAAALLAGTELGMQADSLAAGLGTYGGAARRFEPKGTAGGVRIYDDYAHHPTEVVATLDAARRITGEGRLIVVFQGFRYSRVAAFGPEFGTALAAADEVVVIDTHGGGEVPTPEGDADRIARGVVAAGGTCTKVADRFEASPHVVSVARPGDLVLVMGAAPGLSELWRDLVSGLDV